MLYPVFDWNTNAISYFCWFDYDRIFIALRESWCRMNWEKYSLFFSSSLHCNGFKKMRWNKMQNMISILAELKPKESRFDSFIVRKIKWADGVLKLNWISSQFEWFFNAVFWLLHHSFPRINRLRESIISFVITGNFLSFDLHRKGFDLFRCD